MTPNERCFATATVRIREDLGLEIKEHAKKLNGQRFMFWYGWGIDEGPYQGEHTWIGDVSLGYPLDAPSWMASGDLIFVTPEGGA